MRIFLLLFGSLAVAVALPVQDWVPVESLVAPPGERNPLLRDILPMQGHVIQEDPKPVVQVKPAKLNPAPVVKVMEDTEQGREPLMNEPRVQVQAPLNMKEDHLPAEEPADELEPVQSVPEVAQLNPKELEEEPMVEQEPEKEETFVEDDENVLQEKLMMGLEPEDTLSEEERNILQEEELLDAVAPPIMERDAVPEPDEVYHRNPNEFLEEPIMELEPKEEEAFVEDGENFLQEEASKEAEELVMGLEPQEALAEEERSILQEEELLDAVALPIMERDAVPEPHEVHQGNPNEFLEEPIMELEPKEEEAFVEDEENFLQEEASKEAEELVMGLEPQEALAEEERNILQEEELLDAVGPPFTELDAVPHEEPHEEPHEVHQRNPNEFIGEPVMELQSEGAFVEDEEALMGNFEAVEGPPMQGLSELEPEYLTALDSALEYEPSQNEFLMQHQIQQGTKEAESNMMENLPSEEELMMADQAYVYESLMDQNTREKREDNEIEPSYSDPSSSRLRSCNGVVITGKCYVFFSGPKKAADAEFFCQDNFPNGHLASVTRRYIHDHMMALMDKNGGRRRTWIGGLRYLDTGRWIWLDGARWVFADWLPGEPNNTAGVENCVEILSNGKFNDMPCWDLRAFICSYPF